MNNLKLFFTGFILVTTCVHAMEETPGIEAKAPTSLLAYHTRCSFLRNSLGYQDEKIHLEINQIPGVVYWCHNQDTNLESMNYSEFSRKAEELRSFTESACDAVESEDSDVVDMDRFIIFPTNMTNRFFKFGIIKLRRIPSPSTQSFQGKPINHIRRAFVFSLYDYNPSKKESVHYLDVTHWTKIVPNTINEAEEVAKLHQELLEKALAVKISTRNRRDQLEQITLVP